MALKIYEKRNNPNERSEVRLCRVNTRHSQITFNVKAYRDLGIEKGMRILFAADTDTGQYFFSLCGGEESGGNTLREVVRSGRISGFTAHNKTVAKDICDEVGAKCATFLISAHPRREGGREWYRIITSTPYKLQ